MTETVGGMIKRTREMVSGFEAGSLQCFPEVRESVRGAMANATVCCGLV